MPELKQTVEPSLETTLRPLLEQRQIAKHQIAALEHELDDVNDAIKNTLIQAGELDIIVDGQRVTLDLERSKSSLSAHALLEQGVTTDQIQKATKVTTHIQLDVRKAAKGAA